MAAALLAAACGRGAGGDATLSEGPGATAAPSPADVPSTATAPTTTTTTTARPGNRATTTAPAAASTTPRPTARPLTPPASGTYRYTTQGQSTLGTTVLPFPGVTTLVVEPPSGTRQRAVRDLRNAGNGPVFEYVLDYLPDGIHLVSLAATVSFLVFNQQDSLRPPSPVLFLPTGAEAGTRREVDVPTSTGGTAHLVIEVRSATVVHLSADIEGQLSNHIDLRVTLDPSTRLWTQEQLVAVAVTPTGEVAFRSEYTAGLQR